MRREKGWPQKVILDRMGVSQPTYSAWESGTRKPTYDQLLALAELYETNIVELIKEDGYVFNFHNNSSAQGFGNVETYNGITADLLQLLRKQDDERFERIEQLFLNVIEAISKR